ncbi:MAG: GNAT family N-acetyltransferase [Candidatus Woesearchaeota archaeon]
MICEKLKRMFEAKMASALPPCLSYFEVVARLNGVYRLSMVCNSYGCGNVGHLDAAYSNDDFTFNILSIGLGEDVKGKGYGKKLLEAVESLASELGAKKIIARDSLEDKFWMHMGYLPQPPIYPGQRMHFEKKLY